MIRAKPEVEGLSAYSAPLEGRRGKLRLDFNENTVGPSPKVIEVLRTFDPASVATYPEYDGLASAYALAVGIPSEHVSPFNGVDAAIRAVFDAFGAVGRTFLTTSPTFGYYGPCAAQQGMKLEAIPYTSGLDFPEGAFADALAASPLLCFICNPNNPTGTLLSGDTILAFARRAPDTLVVVDELYADFTGVTVLPEALTLPNVVVLRSLSKSHGLAALRVGFAVGSPAVLDRLQRVTGPYDLNSLAVAAAHAALSDEAYKNAYVSEVLSAKAWTVTELERRGERFHTAGGNYMLVWPSGSLAAVVEGLSAAGVLVRSMAGKPLIGESFRLTIGTRDQMARFMAVFDAVRVAP